MSPIVTTFVVAVRDFLRLGHYTTDKINIPQATLQMGCMLEEVAEKIGLLADVALSPAAEIYLREFEVMMLKLAMEMKQGKHQGEMSRVDPEKLLEASCAIAFSSIGSTYAESTNAMGALNAVATANLMKFTNGIARKDGNGKTIAPKGWVPADLSKFVAKDDDAS